ncbi:hypothetical protein ABBQ32_006397 [Trebouxia sp. C0010 RCD-2024]
MDPKYQRVLAPKLQEHANSYQLTDVSFRSFEMVWAWQRQTASDTVHAVTALLDMTTAKQLAANDDAKDRFCAGGLIVSRRLGSANVGGHQMWNLSHQDISNKEMLTTPIALAKLGWFLMEARQHQSGRHKDVIMISPPDQDKMCLVLGVVRQPTLGSRKGNTLGTAFRSAAADTEAQVEDHGFDSSVMRISADDVQRFTMVLWQKLSDKKAYCVLSA